MKTMRTQMIGLAICIAAFAISAAAQTTVTSSGTTATTGNIPYVSAATSTSTTIEPSPISVSGSNVGIGMTNGPLYTLDVNGIARLKELQIDDVAKLGVSGNTGIGLLDGNNAFAGQMYGITGGGIQFTNAAGVDTLTLMNNGNVGIGTTNPNPSFLLTVDGNGVFTRNYSNGSGLIMTANYGSYGAIQAVNYGNGSAYNLALQQAGGNVGIGTTNPGAKLEVNGGLRFTSDPSGTVQTTAWTGVLCGGDYAEAVNASGNRKSYEPGDVLILTEDGKQDVAKSSEPYSTMVAGIYATKPGVIGRRQSLVKDDEELPMAMVGIVPTKVSAENGAIHRGDLLVSSSTPGYAMKGTDRSRMLGAVIGKAMGALNDGTGVIEVLVTLQ